MYFLKFIIFEFMYRLISFLLLQHVYLNNSIVSLEL